MSKNNSRTIKCTGDCIENKSKTLHPITLGMVGHKNETSNMCPVNKFMKKNKNFTLMEDCNKEKDQLDSNTLYQQMMTPSIIVDIENILSLYKIENIQDLGGWIDENINEKPYDNLNRVLNVWIKININDLKLFNNALVTIIKKIIMNFDKSIKEKYIDNHLKDFIEYWVNMKKNNSFEYNLIYDFKKYLNKKYGSK